MIKGFFFLAIIGLSLALPLRDGGDLKYYALDQFAHKSACLDGSAYGFYFAPATDPAYENITVIYAEGGGWCYNEVDCYYRSFGSVGTSKGWPVSTAVGGLLSSDCSISPDFCKANRAFLPYCDGNSFSGTREAPLSVMGKDLYFRGRYNLEASLITLKEKFSLSTSDSVLFTGCSAGGLTTYLHADYVGEWLKNNTEGVKRYKAAPISGFFLNHNNVEDIPVYPMEMQKIFSLSQPQVNDKCMASKKPEDQWMCNFASDTYDHIDSPIFVINSAVDSWQTWCILTAEPVVDEVASKVNGNCSAAAGWRSCASKLDNCTPDQIAVFNGYSNSFVGTLRMSPTFDKNGNGAFVYSCHMHCAAQSDAYAKIKVNGLTIQQAVSKWWNDDVSTPASQHSYMPCLFNAQKPYQCNPTCAD